MDTFRTFSIGIIAFWLVYSMGYAQEGKRHQAACQYEDIVDGVTAEGQEKEISFTHRDFENYGVTLEFKDQEMESYRGKRVIDVGAGLSDFTDVMAEEFGADAVAVDIAFDELKLDHVSKFCRDLFYRRHFAMDARTLRFPNNFFDLVVSNYLLNWFFFGSKDPTKERVDSGFQILEEMIRVVAVGGTIRTSHVPHPNASWIQGNPKSVVASYGRKMRALQAKYAGIVEFAFPNDESRVTVIRKLAPLSNESLQGKVRTTGKRAR
jgi:ubiquinone/menaquinone biosynthesis C-methylase UbiE